MAISSARTLLCCLLIIVSITTLGCGYRVSYSSFNASEAAVTTPTSGLGNCNLSVGSWIHDDSFPLYDALQCPFISSRINCQKNGRPDSDYQKWRWSPQACNMPRFNGLDFLERIRGRRLLFVGDSISRNQWESMVCLLQGLIPDDRKSMVNQYPLLSFKALDYGVSVDFNWAPFLVEVDMNAQQQTVLKLDIIGPSGIFWEGANILVFESGGVTLVPKNRTGYHALGRWRKLLGFKRCEIPKCCPSKYSTDIYSKDFFVSPNSFFSYLMINF